MKNLKWIALAVLIVVLVAGATGAAAYNTGKQAGVTEGLAARNNFLQARGGGRAGSRVVKVRQQGGSSGSGQRHAWRPGWRSGRRQLRDRAGQVDQRQ